MIIGDIHKINILQYFILREIYNAGDGADIAYVISVLNAHEDDVSLVKKEFEDLVCRKYVSEFNEMYYVTRSGVDILHDVRRAFGFSKL